MEAVIKNAEDSKDKYTTYREMTGRHKLAMKHGFYLEALLIDYAMLEDRLFSFLWAAGAVGNLKATKIKFGVPKNREALRQVFYSFFEEDKKISIYDIASKINVVLSMIAFAENCYDGDNEYLIALHKGMNTLDLVKLKETLTAVNEWRKYRNEVIHGVMNKNIAALNESVENHAEMGMTYARVIDNETKKLQRRKYIRQSVGLSLNK